MPEPPPVKEKPEEQPPVPFSIGPGLIDPQPLIHAAREAREKEEPLDYSTTLPYPFRPRLPAWFVDEYTKSHGDTIPAGELTPEEQQRWQLLLPEGMTPDQAKEQIYEPGYLKWSKAMDLFREKKGEISRLERARLFDEAVRQEILMMPEHPINTLEQSSQEEEQAYMERNEGKTYAQLGLELFNDHRSGFQKANKGPGTPWRGLGYELKEIEGEPNKRRRVDLLTYEKERFLSVFADPDFDFGAVDKKGNKLLSAGDLYAIRLLTTRVDTIRFEAAEIERTIFKNFNLPERYEVESREIIPALQATAPKQWEKLMEEIAGGRLRMPGGGVSPKNAAAFWMAARGALPFGDKVHPLTQEELMLLSIIDPSHQTKELAGGVAGLFLGGTGTYKAFDFLRKGKKVKAAYGVLLGGDAALGAAYAHSAPGYLASVSGKPDSYLLNAVEAATIAGVFQLGFWGFSRLKGQRASVTADEIEEFMAPSLSQKDREAIIVRARGKLERADIPDPDTLPPVAGEDVLAVGTPGILERSKNWYKRMFTASRGLPDEWMYWKQAADSATMGRTMGKMSRELTGLKEMHKKLLKGRPLTGRDLEELNRALEFGRVNDLRTWPLEMRESIVRLREHRKAVSAEFRKVVPGLSEELRHTIDYNMQNYMHRSYRVYDEGETWVKGMLPKGGVKNIKDAELRAVYGDAFNFIKKQWGKKLKKDFLKNRGEVASVEELDQLVHNELSNFLKTRDASDYYKASALTSDSLIITDIIKKRKNIPVSIRALMGEYKNPFVNYEKTLYKMAQHIEAAKMFSNIRASGLRNGLVLSDEAMKPAVQDIRKSAGFEGAPSTTGAKVGSPEFGQAASRMKFFVTMPPKTIDGLPNIRYFATRKAAQTFRDAEWQKIPSKGGSPELAAGMTQLSKSPRFGALAGHWVRNDLAIAINEVDDLLHLRSADKPVLDFLGKSWMSGVAAVNVGKTVFSHVTQIRNVIGGYMINAANGRFYYKGGGKTAGALWDDLKHLKKEEVALKVDEWRKLGLMSGDVQLRHIDELFKDTNFRKWLNAPPDEAAGFLNRWSKQALNKPMKLYGQVDNFFRIMAYEDELRRLTKAYDGWSGTPRGWSADKVMPAGFYNASQKAPMSLKNYASELVNNTYQSYDRVSKGIQNLKVTPFGNFVSFHAEMYRVSKNTMKQGWSEIRHTNPAIRKMGARRLASFMVVGVGGSYAAKEGLNYIFSKNGGYEFNDEREQAMLHFLPDYQRNNELVVTSLKDGQFQFYDMTYNNPFSFANKTARAAFMAGKWEDRGYTDVVKEMLGPAGGEKILVKAILEAHNGKDEFGGDIWVGSDSEFLRTVKGLDHITKVLPPRGAGSYQSIKRFIEVSKGKREGSVPHELVGQLLGMRHYNINLLDPVKSPLIFKGSKYSGAKGEARRIFTSAVVTPRRLINQRVPPEDQLKAWQEANQRLFKAQKALYESVQAAKTLGLKDGQIYKMLNADSSSTRISGGDWRGPQGLPNEGIINGYFTPFMPDFASLDLKVKPRGGVIAKTQLIDLFQKYKRAELALDGEWTNNPVPPKERR